MLAGDNPGRSGGAAGNRTRVQIAYYARVYLHSPAETGPVQYRRGRLTIEERASAAGHAPGRTVHLQLVDRVLGVAIHRRPLGLGPADPRASEPRAGRQDGPADHLVVLALQL